ncbi:amidohydrolase family protein [Vibrio pectenicida]|uniref:Amidohydrolase n=1 Tax=Vibrio pectenicida TaxID=62763 RepID=A0A3R9EIU3_9VIBR|nr:amidohydrolase family protein [Vibrio pectenicida]RSD31386.1 amidohydrolase [Vibrio pectenicida]
MFKLIDSHLHFFDFENGDYHWLKPDNPPFWQDKSCIARSFTQGDLQLSPTFELSGYVHIEAGYDNDAFWREIEWLEKNNTLPFKAVASADLTRSPEKFAKDIIKLKQYRSVTGVRHIFDEQTLSLLNNSYVLKNLEQLAANSLSFDLQMPFNDSKATNCLLSCMGSLSQLRVIINHAGFPPLTNDPAWETWLSSINSVAKYPNVAIKCSGWEMKCRDYNLNWVNDVIYECIKAFSHDRVMLASNFPLCLFSESYQSFWEQFLQMSPDTMQALLYDNACYWYKF